MGLYGLGQTTEAAALVQGYGWIPATPWWLHPDSGGRGYWRPDGTFVNCTARMVFDPATGALSPYLASIFDPIYQDCESAVAAPAPVYPAPVYVAPPAPAPVYPAPVYVAPPAPAPVYPAPVYVAPSPAPVYVAPPAPAPVYRAPVYVAPPAPAPLLEPGAELPGGSISLAGFDIPVWALLGGGVVLLFLLRRRR